MDIFDLLTLLGGLSLFLFGMSLMGQALERRAGGKLRTLLGKMTGRKIVGLLTGIGVTAVIQSSSATTVMVVGFVNSGLMTLEQVIDGLKEQLRTNHILRLQREKCSMEAGFIWADILTALERAADHCSNIAGCMIDMKDGRLQLHESQRETKLTDENFARLVGSFAEKYAL